MTFQTINDAYLFALSPEGQEEIAGEEAGRFLVSSSSRPTYWTMRAAILAELATLEGDELEQGVRRMSVNGVCFGNPQEVRFAATARLDSDYLYVAGSGALKLLNDEVDFTEDDAFGAPVDFIRP